MPIELPVGWIVALNVLLWPVIQMGLAWAFTRMPVDCFDPPRGRVFVSAGFYERFLRIKSWKDRLPDGARWFDGGFAKRAMTSRDPDYLRRFIRETWRGESCHWCAFFFVPLFFLWNPWWADWVMLAYAVLANAPCIVAQRYNRMRLRRLLEGGGRHASPR